MGHINISLDANATLALTQAAGQRTGREPTVVDIWAELILFLGTVGPPPEAPRGEKDQVLEFQILVK